MNQSSIDYIKEELAKDDSLTLDKCDKLLNEYIMFKARKALKGNAGHIADEQVFSWARHVYIEDKDTIKKEMEPEPQERPQKQAAKAPEPPKPEPRKEEGQMTIFDLND